MKKILLILLFAPLLPGAQVYYNGPTSYTNKEQTFVVYDSIHQVSLTNLIGEILYDQKYNDELRKVSIPNFPKGIYIVKINGLVVGRYAGKGVVQFLVHRTPPTYVCNGCVF
jgi:hypothetical protein